MKVRRKKNRTSLYLVMLLVGIFLGTLCVKGISLKADCDKLTVEQSQLEEKKKSLEKEQEDIEAEKSYRNTDAYIEDVAREKFGLVYDNEIIFQAK